MKLPVTVHDLSPQWLSEALAPTFPGVEVTSVEVVDVAHGTNSNARLRLAYGNDGGGAPPSMYAKMPPTNPERRAAVARTGMGGREAQFYRDLASKVPQRVPTAYVALNDDASGDFVLLLEDLEAAGCAIPSGVEGVSVEAAAVALEEFAELHGRYEDPERRAATAAWVPASAGSSTYGAEMLQYGLDHHRDRLTDAFAELSAIYIANISGLHALWHHEPHTILHGDGHATNLFDDGGRIGFLDWGLITVGNPMRDVSYFLIMSLSPEDRRAHERELLAHYLDVRQTSGHHVIAWDAAWLDHRLQAIYTVVASCQIVTFPAGATAARGAYADAFLKRCETAIDDLESLDALRNVGAF